MSEHTGVVVAKSEFGILFKENGPWFNWATENQQGQPFDHVDRGDRVRVEYAPYERKDGSQGYYIYVIENLSHPPTETDAFEPFPPEENPDPFSDDSDEGSDEPNRDRLIVRQTCLKAAGMALQHATGNAEEKSGAITYLAGVLEDWCWR